MPSTESSGIPEMIDRFAAGGETLFTAIADLSESEFQAFPVPGTWSIGQIVVHLMDSDLIGCDRMKRVIAEEKPSLIGYDESAFAAKLFYNEIDPFTATDILTKNRALMTQVLRKLPAETFGRVGIHNERGAMTLADLVKGYTDHLRHHVVFIEKKRRMLRG